jgi:PKD repeat protein
MLLLAFAASACNLVTNQSIEQTTLTAQTTTTLLPSRTPLSTSGVPTLLPIGSLIPTLTSVVRPTNVPPTAIVIQPTRPQIFPATNTPLPVSILILSPLPGNVVAGNVQVLGAAIHPQFLQYQLEYGPESNPNLWYPATAAIQTPIINGILGIWNTNTPNSPDGVYSLRLRVYLRDGTTLATVVGNIRVQNRTPTPVPSATPNIPRPIAAFSVNVASGQVPLTVQFQNQSGGGEITSFNWNFGDNSGSTERDPIKTFNRPGLYTVTLTVSGPGGSSNVSRQINVQSPDAPVSSFSASPISGTAPLTVQFTDQSRGNITSRLWNFSDGGASNTQNPLHVFAAPGIYNVFLTVTGPGGSSTSTRQITVLGPVTNTLVPTATHTFTPTFTLTATQTASATLTPSSTTTVLPPTLTFTPSFTPTFTETPTLTVTASATATLIPTFTETPTLTVTASATPTLTATATLTPTWTFTPIPPPTVLFTYQSGGAPLAIQFNNQSSGDITGYLWDFGDGQTSSEVNPLHSYAAPGTYTVTLNASGAGGTNFLQQQVVVEEPLSAAFSTQPAGALAIQFINQSSGAVSYLWSFGDGGSSTDVNPIYTYAAPSAYNVTLTVTSGSGAQTSTMQTITVNAPPTVDFTSAPVEGSPLSVQFTSSITGEVVGYTWDFGDGQTSGDPNPINSYAAAGDYNVSLTILGTDGSTVSVTYPVTVVDTTITTEPPTAEPGIVDETPIEPDIAALYGSLRGIYDSGAAAGIQASLFARAGDESLIQTGYLDVFATPGMYQLDVHGGLQPVIDWYATGGSFTRPSLAANNGWRAQDLLNPAFADGTFCDLASGETPFACELRASGAAVVLISIGFNDIVMATDPEQFRLSLEQLVETASNRGVIPVLFTARPGLDAAQTEAINTVIIETAEAYQLPVVNIWRALDAMPDPSLVASPLGAGDLSDPQVTNYAINALNLYTLQVLSDLRTQIYPDAP